MLVTLIYEGRPPEEFVFLQRMETLHCEQQTGGGWRVRLEKDYGKMRLATGDIGRRVAIIPGPPVVPGRVEVRYIQEAAKKLGLPVIRGFRA